MNSKWFCMDLKNKTKQNNYWLRIPTYYMSQVHVDAYALFWIQLMACICTSGIYMLSTAN